MFSTAWSHKLLADSAEIRASVTPESSPPTPETQIWKYLTRVSSSQLMKTRTKISWTQ